MTRCRACGRRSTTAARGRCLLLQGLPPRCTVVQRRRSASWLTQFWNRNTRYMSVCARCLKTVHSFRRKRHGASQEQPFPRSAVLPRGYSAASACLAADCGATACTLHRNMSSGAPAGQSLASFQGGMNEEGSQADPAHKKKRQGLQQGTSSVLIAHAIANAMSYHSEDRTAGISTCN
jgi:hypothetical protein